jgi:PIF1 helicase.
LPSSLSSRRMDNGSERTLHNVFKLPIPILKNSVANITANSSYGRFINSSLLIIIDEVSMCPLQLLKIIDRLLRDLCDENDKRKRFGRKTILL